MYRSGDRAHDDEVVERLRLVPLVRDLAAEDGTVALVEHRQALEGSRVLRNECALADDLDILAEVVRLRELGRVREELVVREAGEGVREFGVEVLDGLGTILGAGGGIAGVLDEGLASLERGLVA